MSSSSPVALITGCSSGIGRALAVELAARGARVFASARKPDTLRELETKQLTPLALDVTSRDSIAGAVETVIAQAGRIDLLINNAGFNTIGPLAEVPLEDVRRLFDTNVTGLLAVTQAVFPHMAERRAGRIVNVGSVVGLLPTPFAGPYCATKSAVHMLSEVLRMELAPFGIDVIVVQPGGVRSAISDTASVGIERYEAESSRYAFVAAQIRARARASQDRPMEADAFARKVVAELLAEAPASVLREGRGALLYPALARLPRGVRDRLMQRRFKLFPR